MKARIVNQFVKRLEPVEKPFEVSDSDLPGFLLRVQPTGTMIYYAAYRLQNRRRNRVRLGSAKVLSPSQARKKAKAILADVARGRDPAKSHVKASSHTLKSFLDQEYGPWVRTHHKTGERTLQRIEACFGGLMKKRLDELSPWWVEKWKVGRIKKGRAPMSC